MRRKLKALATSIFLAFAWIGAAIAAETDNYWLNYTGPFPIPPSSWTARFSLAATTTVHLGVQSTFATAGMNASGIIRARRVR